MSVYHTVVPLFDELDSLVSSSYLGQAVLHNTTSMTIQKQVSIKFLFVTTSTQNKIPFIH
jgi:hypothetical protein